MTPNEPQATALLLATCGLLLAISVLFSRASQRFGVPIALLFLGVGMLAGSEGIGGIEFTNYQVAFRIGVLALALILFDGGLNTPLAAVRSVARPAGLLAWAAARTVNDISLGGIRTYADAPVPVGRRMELELLFAADQTATVLAEVAWAEVLGDGAPARHEMGLHLISASPEAIGMIKRALGDR